MFDKFWSRMIKNIHDYKALIIFVMLIALGLSILLIKAEFPFSQNGHIEMEGFGIQITENLKYTQSKQYPTCLKS